VPLPALAAMDASLRQACRYRVSSYRRRETQELRHRARRARAGSHPRAGPLLRDLAGRSRYCRRGGGADLSAIGTRTKGGDASRGRRWCSGRGRRRVGDANGRGRPDTAKPTTTTKGPYGYLHQQQPVPSGYGLYPVRGGYRGPLFNPLRCGMPLHDPMLRPRVPNLSRTVLPGTRRREWPVCFRGLLTADRIIRAGATKLERTVWTQLYS
jgi:hypothetical protein